MVGGKLGFAAKLPEMSLITSGSSLCISDTDGSRLDGKSKPGNIGILAKLITSVYSSTDLRMKNIQPTRSQNYLDSLEEPMELLNSLFLP